MQFFSEAQRLAHPQARLIPTEFFYSEKLFNLGVEESELAAMTMNLAAMDELTVNPSNFSSPRQLRYWLCILLGHASASREDLLNAAQRFSLPPETLFYGALLTNRLDLIDGIDTTTPEIRDLISFNDYALFRFAASLGYVEVLQRLAVLVSPADKAKMIAAGGYDAFRRAAGNGHLPVLSWLKMEAGEQWQTMLFGPGTFERWNHYGYNALSLAVNRRCTDVLGWLNTEAAPQLQAMIEHNQFGAFRAAAGSGDLAMLEWLETNVTESQLQAMIEAGNYGAFHWAARGGHVHILEWLKAKAPAKLQAMIAAGRYKAFCDAAANGELPVMQWLKANAPTQWQAMITAQGIYEDGYAFSSAAEGRVDILNWFKAEALEYLPTLISQHNYLAFRVAAARGNVEILDWFKAEVTPEILQLMIAAHEYNAFTNAAAHGHVAVLNWLKENAAAQLHAMLIADDYKAFREAAENGHVDVLNWFKAEAPEQLDAMITAHECQAFFAAAENNHRLVLDWLITEAPEQLEGCIRKLFSHFAFQGDVDSLNWLSTKVTDEKLKEHLAAFNYRTFRVAVRCGHIKVLNWLKEKMPEQIYNMITSTEPNDPENSVILAARNGHVQTLDWLKNNVAEEQLYGFVIADNYRAFREAAYHGQTDVLKWFKREFPTEFSHMLAANNHEVFCDYEAYFYEAEETRLATLDWLIAEAPEQLETALTYDNFKAFRKALENKHPRIAHRLLNACPAGPHQQAMLALNNYEAFHFAAEKGDLGFLNQLVNLCSSAQLQEMLRGHEAEHARLNGLWGALLVALVPGLNSLLSTEIRDRTRLTDSHDYRGFREAAANGHLDVINRFLELCAPHLKRTMLLACHCGVLCEAAEHGHLAVVERIIETCTPELLEEILKERGYGALYAAAEHRHQTVVNRLLRFSSLFESFESPESHSSLPNHVGSFIVPFISAVLTELHTQQREWAVAHGETPFNITDPEKAKLCFFLLRNLIRRNDPTVFEEIRFLLEIPAVRALAHLQVGNSYEENALLHLATRKGNQRAARLLLAIPAVNDIAVRLKILYRFDAEETGFNMEGLINCRERLQAYIRRVEGAHAAPDFSHGFLLFRQSRAINREANYLLAKSLLRRIDRGEEPLERIFADIHQHRHQLIVENALNHREGYAERDIHSRELNGIIRTGLG